jgi:hypothetical protein
LHVAFVSKSVLRSHWDLEYRARQDSSNEKALDDRLTILTERTHLKETSAESAFIDVLFRETLLRELASRDTEIARQSRQ